MNKQASGSSDRIYAEEHSTLQDFAFDKTVTQVFDDMVRRSVPGYDSIVELIGVIAGAHSRTLNRPLFCLDLGCSRGRVTQHLLSQLADPATRIEAVDSSEAMIKAAQNEISDERVKFIRQDILESEIRNVDFVVMNLVLQFLEPDKRLGMLQKIRRGLREDGMFVLTEKIRADAVFFDYHYAFKRAKGYSELEITQKRDALEKVMIIDSLETHQDRLRNAGFKQVKVWFQLLNWVSLIARP